MKDPYIRLMLSVLESAKQEAGNKEYPCYWNVMWYEFKRDYLKGRAILHPDPLHVALWVGEFIQRNGVEAYCQSVRDKDISRERVK